MRCVRNSQTGVQFNDGPVTIRRQETPDIYLWSNLCKGFTYLLLGVYKKYTHYPSSSLAAISSFCFIKWKPIITWPSFRDAVKTISSILHASFPRPWRNLLCYLTLLICITFHQSNRITASTNICFLKYIAPVKKIIGLDVAVVFNAVSHYGYRHNRFHQDHNHLFKINILLHDGVSFFPALLQVDSVITIIAVCARFHITQNDSEYNK